MVLKTLISKIKRKVLTFEALKTERTRIFTPILILVKNSFKYLLIFHFSFRENDPPCLLNPPTKSLIYDLTQPQIYKNTIKSLKID